MSDRTQGSVRDDAGRPSQGPGAQAPPASEVAPAASSGSSAAGKPPAPVTAPGWGGATPARPADQGAMTKATTL
ncbi:MAG: hypothetical protein JWQ53_1823, partial [Klenkia sp.]|nr:hypothetical protein [Klenkia sp.]